MAHLGTAVNLLSTPSEYNMNLIKAEKMIVVSLTPISEPSTNEKFTPIITKKFETMGMMRSIRCSRLRVGTMEISGNGENLTKETFQFWG